MDAVGLWVLAIGTLLALTVDATCVWYGIGERIKAHEPIYAAYNGSARPLNDSVAFDRLKSLCPNYALAPDSPLCCDADQVKYFAEAIGMAGKLLNRCPACWANFRLLMCAMTCDPDQANFLTPMVGGNLVRSVMYNLTVSVRDGFFTSCKDVQFSDGRSVDLMCDSEVCTPELLLRGLEDHSPFPLKFVVTPDYKYGSLNVSEKRAYNHPMYGCNQAVPARGSDSGGPSCSCTDCEGSCHPRVSASPPRVLKLTTLKH